MVGTVWSDVGGSVVVDADDDATDDGAADPVREATGPDGKDADPVSARGIMCGWWDVQSEAPAARPSQFNDGGSKNISKAAGCVR